MLRNTLRSSARIATRAVRMNIARSAMRPSMVCARQFHLTRPTWALSASDAELVSTLKSEIELETENVEEESAVVSKFLSDSGFKVIAKDGADLIELVKQDGGEVVHVYFSLFDVSSEAFETPEEQENAEEFEEEIEDDDVSNPIQAKIVIERPHGKALSVETTIHDDLFLIQYMQPHADASTALSNTAEADHQRRLHYQGPVYSTLDPAVQGAVERYLESRGVNSEMAAFIIEYANSRENKEYISWLKQVKDVVSE